MSSNPTISNTSSARTSLELPLKDKSKQPRQGRACDTCRRRKVRCEGGGPASEPGETDQPCTLCVAQSIPCTFEQRTTKRGPPKGYVESLERRLEAMEGLLAQFAGKDGRLAPHGSSPSTPPVHDAASKKRRSASGPDEEALFPTSMTASPGSSTCAAQPQTGLDAIEELGLKLDDLAIEQNRYVGRGSGIHLIRSMEQYAEPFSPSIMDEILPSSTVEALLHEEHDRHKTDVMLPSDELGRKLVNAAFEKFSLGRIIPRAYFEDCFNKGMVESDITFKGLYFAILALGSRAIPNTNDAALSPREAKIVEGWRWFKAALHSGGSPLASASLFTLLRAVVLVVWVLGSAGWVSGWHLVGFNIRQAIDIGAHCEGRSYWLTSPLRNQLRKRAFVTLVALDYYLSATLGRPFAIQEEDWDVSPPLGISDEDLIDWDHRTNLARLNGLPLPPQPPLPPDLPPVSPTSKPPSRPQQDTYPWESFMSLHSIMALTMKSLFGLKRDKTLKGTRDAVRDIDSRLNAWLEKVPAHIRWNPSQQDDEALMVSAAIYSGYYSCQIFAHREFVSPSRSAALGFPSLAICSNAARSSAHVLDTLRQRGLVHRAFTFAPITAVQSAFVLLLGRFASSDSNTQLTPSAAADVKRCINVLHDLAPTTYMAMQCYEGMVKLATLVATPPSARASNPLSASTSSQHKRANPDDWDDGQSPAASASDRPSPSSQDWNGSDHGGSFSSSTGHKQRKLNQPSDHRGGTLPLSTLDLSAETFKGRPTFAANATATSRQPPPSTSVPPPSSQPSTSNFSYANPPLNPPFNPNVSSSSSNFSDVFTQPLPPPIPSSSAQFPQSTLPAFATDTFSHIPTSLPDPNLATPTAFDPMLDLNLQTDFFAFLPSSSSATTATSSSNQIPPDVGRAAQDLWTSFSTSMEGTNDLANPGGGVRAGEPGGNWNPQSNFTSSDFASLGNLGGGGGGGGGGGTGSAGFDPFSQWNLSSPTGNGSFPSTNTDPNSWNYFDPSTLNNSPFASQ